MALAGCSTTAGTIDSGDKLAKAANGSDSVVFGKFTLVRNGEEAKLNDGMFATTASLHVIREDGQGKIVGRVGKDGEFAWALAPGDYRITTIDFDNRGEREETASSLAFTVPADGKPVYIGTIRLEASFDNGYYGTNGAVDDFFVKNDCATDCARRLEALGLSATSMHVDVVQQQVQLARTN
jgi:hypothetical protein